MLSMPPATATSTSSTNSFFNQKLFCSSSFPPGFFSTHFLKPNWAKVDISWLCLNSKPLPTLVPVPWQWLASPPSRPWAPRHSLCSPKTRPPSPGCHSVGQPGAPPKRRSLLGVMSRLVPASTLFYTDVAGWYFVQAFLQKQFVGGGFQRYQPLPAGNAWPMATISTSSGSSPARRKAAPMAALASLGADISDRPGDEMCPKHTQKKTPRSPKTYLLKFVFQNLE